MRNMRYMLGGLALAAALALPHTAQAFCGFYVSGAGADLFNNATQVVLMREGTRTVLSMQNNYQGPPQDFAMVVPVPVVLQEENVKTLDKAIFQRVDALAAPRLVEYWEQDPCAPQVEYKRKMSRSAREEVMESGAPADDKDLGVKIEAQFTVGEYQIVILSARDSTGLDTWLRQNKYKIPEGAEPLLRPYVQSGMKFFVAKVDVEKVKMEKGMAMLSPLRFHYDSDEFSLPVRLGMINSAGTQDLIVHVLAQGQRYEVANYKNVTIPTNLDVKDAARDRFGEFYAALFDRTLEANPGAVVTEYSWDASSCDPCPTPALTPDELATLGYDVLYTPMSTAAGNGKQKKPAQRVAPSWPGSFVLTRLHLRYGKGALADDLVFRAAPPIAGGREFPGTGGGLEQGAISSGSNNFQARYAIRHAWTGKIACDNPQRGIWGGPPAGTQQIAASPKAATNLAFAPRGKIQLASFVTGEIPGLGAVAETPAPAGQTGKTGQPGDQPQDSQAPGTAPEAATPDPAKTKTSKGCEIATSPRSGAGVLVPMLLFALALAGLRQARLGHARRTTRP